MSTLESLHCGHFTSSPQLIKPNYLKLLLYACSVFFIVFLKRTLGSQRTLVTIPLNWLLIGGDKDGNGAGSKAFYH